MTRLSPKRTAQLAGGAVLAAVVVVAAVGATLIDLPGHLQEPIRIAAQPPAAPSVAVCSGPLIAAGRDATQASLLTDDTAQRITAAAGGDVDPVQSLLVPADVAGGTGPALLAAPPSGVDPTDLAAAGAARAAASDLSGFAAEACTRPMMESWLVGGSAATGAGDVVILANPGEVAALVTLAVYGASGEQAPAAGKDIVVPAGTQRIIPLASLARGEEGPVVRVTSAQAPVRASLQTTITRVLNPGGVDQIAALGAPSTDLVIPGVAVAVAASDPGASNTPTILHLLAPGAAGEATVTVGGPDGAVVSSQTLPLSAGVPLTFDLGGLAVGTYSVSVSATTPVTGGVWSTTGFGAGSDFGWFTPAEILRAPTLVAVAEGPSAQLSLVGGAAPQTVTVESLSGGAAREVTLAAGAVARLPVEGGGAYRIVPGEAGVSASVVFAGAGALAGYPVPAGDAAAAAIEVYPR
ncbi:DUF5719 family protein [Microbacterium flavum]|uniref:Large extracellular alpha-helical protein n=1 Tax=Microbacterium flavum TaxID=415216 RepID=A0ABS5XUN4_9MICO|nr:DUF5719 family protein [Microbacterium flavum]MBT8798238.1 large extracellular alpha-helical protein [Microbacterium flavum]